jgi:FlaA1/EpsC-like NDP-sugar epimerase
VITAIECRRSIAAAAIVAANADPLAVIVSAADTAAYVAAIFLAIIPDAFALLEAPRHRRLANPLLLIAAIVAASVMIVRIALAIMVLAMAIAGAALIIAAAVLVAAIIIIVLVLGAVMVSAPVAAIIAVVVIALFVALIVAATIIANLNESRGLRQGGQGQDRLIYGRACLGLERRKQGQHPRKNSSA